MTANKLERLTERQKPEREDHDPATPLVLINREVYAKHRALGTSMTESARIAGINRLNASRFWENPESPTGRAVLARIAHLQSSAMALVVPSVGTMMHELLQTAAEARAAGKFDVAEKIYRKFYDECASRDTGAVDAVGEDVSDEELERGLG